MTVCLVIPPSPFLLDERVFMSLGVLRVAAVLEQAGIPVSVCDLSGRLPAEIAAAPTADVYGLTVTSPQLPAAVDIIRQLRILHPAARIVLGGPHVTLVYAAKGPRAARARAQLDALADVCVAGDGERAIFDALKPNAPKVINADDPKTVLFLRSSDLNELPFPARHLLDVDSYRYTIEGRRALSFIAQLGCPFGCGFCGGRRSPSLRRIRTRTTENVVAEIESLYRRYGISAFMAYDDELNVNPGFLGWLDALTDLQDRLGVGFVFRGFIKAELFTEEQAAAMARAGFRWILVGFESGHDRILENINKKATKAENTRCLQIAHRHGLKVKALMSLGHPGESKATIRATLDWVLQVRPDDFDATVITTYPGTPYFDDAVETDPGVWTYTAPSGDRLHSVDVDFSQTAEYYKGIPGAYRAFTWTDALTSPQLIAERDAFEATARQTLGLVYPEPSFDHSMGLTETTL